MPDPAENTLTLILAGGKGTRLSPISGTLPKPMVPLADKPLLEHILLQAHSFGFNHFLFKTGYGAHLIDSHFGDGKRFGTDISYFEETEPLGTAGGLDFLSRQDKSVIVLYGDVLHNINLRQMLNYHKSHGAQATLAIHASDHPEDSDVVKVDGQGRVVRMVHKPGDASFGNITNAAMYILEPACFHGIPDSPIDFGKTVLPRLVEQGAKVFGFAVEGYMKDIGTPERYAQASADLLQGRVFGNVRGVILDRDGTINEEIHLLHKPEDLSLIPGAAGGIKLLNDASIPVFIATNQPVVARGLCTAQEVETINERLQEMLAEQGASVDGIAYCPHHPDKGFPEERPEYKIDCDCRKPGTGMLTTIAQEHGLPLEGMFMVGDSTSDIKAGTDAGARTILLRSGFAGTDRKYPDIHPDYVMSDLAEAAEFIARYHRSNLSALVSDVERVVSEKGRALVLIGGCSRSGKTHLARALAQRTSHAGSHKVLHLDDWIVDARHRKTDATVRERFDYAAIESAVSGFLSGNAIDAPVYDTSTRQRTGTKRIENDSPNIILVEGVIALDHPVLRGLADLTVFKDVRESVRNTRLAVYNAERGLDLEAFRPEMLKREAEEVPHIKSTHRYARYIL